jgi:hypothetical protein
VGTLVKVLAGITSPEYLAEGSCLPFVPKLAGQPRTPGTGHVPPTTQPGLEDG